MVSNMAIEDAQQAQSSKIGVRITRFPDQNRSHLSLWKISIHVLEHEFLNEFSVLVEVQD